MAAKLVRVAGDRETAEGEGGIEEEGTGGDPAVGDLRRRLDGDATGLDIGDQPVPVGDRAGIGRVAEARGDDQLHIGAHAGREHLLELAPVGDIAGLEGAAGGEGGAGIGILAEDDAAHGLGRDAVEGAEDMGSLRGAGKDASAPGGKHRLPWLERQAGVDGLEAERDIGDDRMPCRIEIVPPVGEDLPHCIPERKAHPRSSRGRDHIQKLTVASTFQIVKLTLASTFRVDIAMRVGEFSGHISVLGDR